MNRSQTVSGVAALLLHLAVLFGIRFESVAPPPSKADEPVEVSLVAEEPAKDSAAAPAAPAPEPPPTLPQAPPIPAAKSVPEPLENAPPATLPPQTPPPSRKISPASAAHAAGSETAGTTLGTAGRGNSIAQPRFHPKPEYPAAARGLRQEGRVILAVSVGADGLPTSVAIAHSSGVPSLDQSALAAVRRWTFEPAHAAGHPIASRVEVPVTFTLSR